MTVEQAYQELAEWCRARQYAGHDPFDGLNSLLFQATPLRSWRTTRLLWTQAFKRSPVNLRTLARVPKQKNAKGTALFALAALARFRTLRTKEAESEARALLGELLQAQLQTKSGAAAWGYNFDWQGRAFFAPRGTPTIVPTAFAARALVEASHAFNTTEYLEALRRVGDFILHDLRRSSSSSSGGGDDGGSGQNDEVCFSYTPLDNTRIFNASLLAAETLAAVGTLTSERSLCEVAMCAARYVVRRQRADGSWAYGADGYQAWADNFHTAFVLTSLARIRATCNTAAAAELVLSLQRGYEFWRARFFLANGWPRYYHHKLYPADAHSAGAAIVALLELRCIHGDGALELAQQIALWTISTLRDPRGFFYYQRRRFYTVRTPYMRWTQAWMLYGLARLLEEEAAIDSRL